MLDLPQGAEFPIQILLQVRRGIKQSCKAPTPKLNAAAFKYLIFWPEFQPNFAQKLVQFAPFFKGFARRLCDVLLNKRGPRAKL